MPTVLKDKPSVGQGMRFSSFCCFLEMCPPWRGWADTQREAGGRPRMECTSSVRGSLARDCIGQPLEGLNLNKLN